MSENKQLQKKNYGGAAFLPLILFLVLYVGTGLVFTLMGQEGGFGMFPRHVALAAGLGLALIMGRHLTAERKLDIFCENMGNSGIMMVVLIYVLAGGFQGAAEAMGGKDSVINFALTHIPAAFLVPGIFLMACFISTAIGTSMGTIAALAPVAVGVAQGAGLNVPLVCAVVIGGSYFGDNLSMISDTTISATQGVGAEMKDKFRMNFFIALPAAIVSGVLFTVMGGQGLGDVAAPGAYSIIKILPYIAVLVMALAGVNVGVTLLLGIALTGVIGIPMGTDFFDWIAGISSGMSGMFDISIVAIMVGGIIGLVREYGGIEWLIRTITSKIKKRRGAEYGIGFMCGLLSAALVNNTIAIIISAPIAKEIGGKYGIAPKRLASLLDIFACAFITLLPHDGGMLIVTGLAGCSPLQVLQYMYYPLALIIATLITIQFGLLRTPEEKEFAKAHPDLA